MNIDTGITALTLIFAFAATYFAWRNLKHRDIESKQTRPTIAHLNDFGKYIHLTITNNKPHPISIHEIIVKKKLFGPIFFKTMPTKWNPMMEYTPANSPQEALARFCKMPEYSISTQQTFLIEFLEHVPECVYKLCVTTTGGKCQSIYRSPLGPPTSQSDTGEKKT
jgi:hypothetical protein